MPVADVLARLVCGAFVNSFHIQSLRLSSGSRALSSSFWASASSSAMTAKNSSRLNNGLNARAQPQARVGIAFEHLGELLGHNLEVIQAVRGAPQDDRPVRVGERRQLWRGSVQSLPCASVATASTSC